MCDIEKAKELLAEGGYTCVACKGEKTYTSSMRGVKPLLNLIDSGKKLTGYSVADKVIGRAAAFLYVELEAQFVHANIISRPALEVFIQYGIPHSYDTKVDAIVNRTNTGPCPMESAVWDIDTPREAEHAIRQKLTELAGN